MYVTVSSDGVPLMGEDGTLLMGLPVTVRYFDLADYGLGRISTAAPHRVVRAAMWATR